MVKDMSQDNAYDPPVFDVFLCFLHTGYPALWLAAYLWRFGSFTVLLHNPAMLWHVKSYVVQEHAHTWNCKAQAYLHTFTDLFFLSFIQLFL